MAPGISLLRKSLRSNANRGYESKPSTNVSTVSSLTCSVKGHSPAVNDCPRFPGGEIDVVKRSITLDTDVESVDVKSSLGSSSGSVLPVRRLSSSSRHSGASNPTIRRGSSIQDEILNREEEKGEIDLSVSSLTLESDIRLYHKAKAKSFNEVRSVPSVGRSRSMTRNRRTSSTSAAGSHSLERIREESSRFTAVTSSSFCSKFTEQEPPSLTLSDLQSVTSSVSNQKSGASVTSDSRSTLRGLERRQSLSNRSSVSLNGYHGENKSHKKPNLQRILSRSESTASSWAESYVSTETLEVISSLHEMNAENESTILRLQHELSEMTNERDAFRTNSDKMMQVLTSQQTELQAQLKEERKGFANMSSVHKKELKEWMDKASMLSTKVLDLEKLAKIRELDDEARSEKIQNLEKSMARLLEMYLSKDTSCRPNDDQDCILDETEVEQSLIDFDATHTAKKFQQLEMSYDESASENKRHCEVLQLEANQYRATIEKLKHENDMIRKKCAEMSTSTCNDELLSKICELTDENTLLTERCAEVDELRDENIALEEELEIERNACQALRDEIRTASFKSIATKEDNSAETNYGYLNEMREANEKLTVELQDKNEAVRLIQIAMDSLKAEQQVIKETVVSLRMENLKLRDEKEEKTKAHRPPPPPHPSIKEKADLKARVDKLEKESVALKEANSSLSMKLSDEVERTKALQIANEGLAARIRTLVNFIKKQAQC